VSAARDGNGIVNGIDRQGCLSHDDGDGNGIVNGIDRQECLSYMNGGMTGCRWCVNGTAASSTALTGSNACPT